MFGSRLAVRNAMTLICLLGLVLLSVAQWRGAEAVLAAGTITGTVFQDYNGNGAQDVNQTIPSAGSGTTRVANDRGLGSVIVTAFNSAGAVVGTATTAANGSYSLSASGTGPYRIEFSGFPTGFHPGPVGSNNGSTVRFVNDGATANVNLGIHLPSGYCQNNPDLVTSCFRAGAQNTVTESSVLSFPYNAGSNSGTTIPDYRVPASHTLNVQSLRTGAVWGLENSRTRDIIYASAFFKKHAGFGPGADGTLNTADDPGAIYLISEAVGAPQTVFTVPGATTNVHDTADYILDGYNVGWNGVGKYSLGGIALSDDEATLYVMNLENRTLYALNATTGAVLGQQTIPGVPAIAGSAASGAAPPLPAPSPVAACATDAIRPFAVNFDKGQLYVGITCTAEGSTTVDTYVESSTPPNGRFDHDNTAELASVVDNDGNGIYNRGDARQMRAYVYTVNPATLAFSAAPAFQFGLSYPRGIANANGLPPAEWRPWVNGFDYISIGERTVYYPQPWLTDLSFDGNNLVLLLRDRTGDTTGFRQPADPTAPPTDLWDGVGVGDVLRACPNALGQLELESNGSCGGITTNPPAGLGPGGLPLEPQGPGGGEYYFDDGYGVRGQTVNHDEVSLGGSVTVEGHPDVVVTTFDAFPLRPPSEVFNSGFRWHGNDTGASSKAYVIFDSDTVPPTDPLTFGKANGLGDLIVLCDEAPIEIGNRVWRDDNLNGVQDPNEPVIPGVTLELYEGNSTTPIATAVTDGEGNYIFSAYRTPGDSTTALRYGLDLKPNTRYTVRIPNATGVNQQAALVGLLPTLANAAGTGGAGGDSRDSDGIQAGTLVAATLITGGVGVNNHTYDFGFVAAPTAITLDSFAARKAGGGAVVTWSTSLEIDTWGYHLYRSATGSMADAVRVSDPLILAKGRGGAGASYSFVDETASGGPYTYWLEEHTTAGARTVYGPVTTEQLSGGGAHRAWLPMVLR